MQEAGFWDSPARNAPILQKRRDIERRLESLNHLRADADELATWRELLDEGEANPDADPEFGRFIDRLEAELSKLELELKLSGPDDDKNAILSIHPGAGGTESQDWAEMLLRMYLRWAEQHGYEVELMDRQDGEEAGLVVPEAARLVASQSQIEQQVVEHDVVQGEHPWQAQGEVEHGDVVAVVPHLVEGEPAAGAGLAGRGHRPGALDGGIDRLVRQPDQADVRQRREVGKEVEAVVGDAGADGGEGGDVVEVHGSPAYTTSSLSRSVAICPLRYASMNGSSPPSSTFSESPTETPVRWSLTMR